jgi:FkbM family methyltransferase
VDLRFRGIDSVRTFFALQSPGYRWRFLRHVAARLGFPKPREGLLRPESSGIVDFEGYRFEMRPGTVDRVVLSPLHELLTRRFLARRLRGAQGTGVFVDVGAHCGSMAIPFERFFARVLALEPLPINFEALQKNIQLNDLAGKVSAFNLAAGQRTERAKLHLTGDDSTSSLKAGGEEIGSVEVDIEPLDELLRRSSIAFADVRLLVVDVEGAEAEVLRGACELLGKGRPCVVAEANDPLHAAENAKLMASFGYRELYRLDGRNFVFERR